MLPELENKKNVSILTNLKVKAIGIIYLKQNNKSNGSNFTFLHHFLYKSNK